MGPLEPIRIFGRPGDDVFNNDIKDHLSARSVGGRQKCALFSSASVGFLLISDPGRLGWLSLAPPF